MDELSKILAVTKAQAAAGTERIAFDPMALAHAIDTGIGARVTAERERCAKLCDEVSETRDMRYINSAVQCAARIRGA